ncbi:hypothetical protein [Streptomyces sp. YIM 103828]|uniref:hypothetical protein n=1 Tax=Streptomyces sp. YIM 103828 TaxID=3158968 RepID=UPI0032D8D804
MHQIFSSAAYPFSSEYVLSLRPLNFSQMADGYSVDVTAAELAELAASPAAARELGARRGDLGQTEPNIGLARLLMDRPEDFGAVGSLVLGADAVEVHSYGNPFGDALHVIGPECIDGLQRLRVIARLRHALTAQHLRRAVIRVEIRSDPVKRERARRAHDDADRYANASTAQDRLIRCPHLQRLTGGDWEGNVFDPRRGVSGPEGRGKHFTMAEVTSALACLAPGRSPAAAHLAATPEGREALWADHGSSAYRALFHARMTPVGVMRAVEARRTAHKALDSLPRRRHQAHGHLITYAPELIAWLACRALPLTALHEDSRRSPDWGRLIGKTVPRAALQAAERLVAGYARLRPERPRTYKTEAADLALWNELTS